MATVIITGGTGMIGTALTKVLVQKGHDIIILSRTVRAGRGQQVSYAFWDPEGQQIEEEAIRKADYIVHLAGANVGDHRWTKKRKKEIVDSRVKSGTLLVQALKTIPNKVKAVISSSAMGIYGPDRRTSGQRPFMETDTPYDDFLATTVQNWEEAIRPVAALHKRLVIFRAGIVLSNEGGAYREFKMPLKFGLASVLGSGRQMVSWIHIEDLVSLYTQAIENEDWQGIYNAVTPYPVTNRELITEMARQTRSHFIRARVPSFVLKLLLGEMSVEVLKSTTVSSTRIQEQGFHFLYPTISEAVKNLSRQSGHESVA